MDVRLDYLGRVIAVGGPPHSGKSVFLEALHNALLVRMGDGAFLERVCPDGEGKWSAEAEPEVVRRLRQKGDFSEEFMRIKLNGIIRLGRTKPLVLLDLGGRMSAENAAILARSTDVILLSGRVDLLGVWEAFVVEQGCRVVGRFESSLVWDGDDLDRGARSVVDGMPMVGRLVNLDRRSGFEGCYEAAVGVIADGLLGDG